VAAAAASPDILAFNTNGFLKHALAPLRSWVSWTADRWRGLYVRDGALHVLAASLLRAVGAGGGGDAAAAATGGGGGGDGPLLLLPAPGGEGAAAQ
jgi:hypothetical protein